MGRRGLASAERLDRGQIARHQRKWLIAAAFAFAQQQHRTIVARIARQVESAQTPDRDNLALAQPPLRFGYAR